MEKMFLITRNRDKKILGITYCKKTAKSYFNKYNLYTNFSLIKIKNEFLFKEYSRLYEDKLLIKFYDEILTTELYNSLIKNIKEEYENVCITKDTVDSVMNKLLVDKESIDNFNKVSKYLNKIIMNKDDLFNKLINLKEHIELYLNSDYYYNIIKHDKELDERYRYLIDKD